MFQLCLSELNDIIEGDVRLGAMPPLAGMLEPIGRVVVDVQQIQSRDVFWSFGGEAEQVVYRIDEAFARGAVGVILQGATVEPWAGRFSINVEDTMSSFHRLLRCTRSAKKRWIRSLFGRDAVTQEAIEAIWNRDSQRIQMVINRLHQPSVAFA